MQRVSFQLHMIWFEKCKSMLEQTENSAKMMKAVKVLLLRHGFPIFLFFFYFVKRLASNVRV